MARKKGGKIFKTPNDMDRAWQKYKLECDNAVVSTTTFSQKDGKYITACVPHPITYTMKGFALSSGMTENNFYETYRNDPEFGSVIACMKEECETDARRKFENGTIDSRLAGLWLSRYGYTTNVDQKIDADMSLNVSIDYGDE